MKAALSVLALLAVSAAIPAQAEPVLMISIDGLRPADVIEAPARGLTLPNLRRFLAEGSYASGVRGVLPSVTYPSHTTLITGTSPARHGIVANTTFDPQQINQTGWFWYAQDIKVPTLWQAAHQARRSVGNVHWPVSVGAAGIDWNLPQVWRTGHQDDAKLLRALATPGLVARLEALRGEPYAAGIDESVGGDENRGRFAASLIARNKPYFTTVYLAGLDAQEHEDGPDSAPAKAVLERLDAVVGQLIVAERAVHPDAVVVLVSDHGFAPVSHETNLFRAFIDAGLIRLDAEGKLAGWDAMPWPTGGSAAVVLARPDDAALRARTADVLAALKADPANGIAEVGSVERIKALRGNPGASFFVNFAIGTSAGSFADRGKGVAGVPHNKGTHGWYPDAPEMRATFMAMGTGIPRGKALGEIDQRAIAPTVARILGARLPQAEVPALQF